MPETEPVVVVGAGVIGLTTALLLSRDNRYSITVIAKHMPGDYDIEYASPWAGANYLPFGSGDSLEGQFERHTWPELKRLAECELEAGIHFQDVLLYKRNKDDLSPTGKWSQHLMSSDPWFREVVPNFEILKQLPEGYDAGSKYTSVCINTALYLPWLVSQCLKNGVQLKRAVLSHIKEAAHYHHASEAVATIINCTGLGSLKLGGVTDQQMYPARAQIVLVRNSPGGVMTALSGTDDGGDEICYIMERAAGGGCVLGGCYQEHSWDPNTDMDLAERIMKRCVEICPTLTGGKGIEELSIIRHGVGLRPARKGGIRIEAEVLDGIHVIHNYGHAGAGYQTSYGSAEAALALMRRQPITARPLSA